MADDVPLSDGSGTARRWREDRIHELLERHTDGALFVSGCVDNQVFFYDRFDAVVLLTAPTDVLLARIETRTTNPFGKDATERERILRDLAAFEPGLRRDATHVVATDRPLADVVAEVEALAS